MAIYTIELDGQQFDLEGPEGASEDELYQAAIEHQKTSKTSNGAQNPANDEASKLRSQIAQLEASKIDPTTINASKARLAALERGETPSFALRPLGQSFDIAGEKTAEGIAEKFPNLPPQVPAAAGLAVQMAPDIAMGFAGNTGAVATKNAARSTKLGRFLGASKKVAGEEIGRIERAAGARLPRETETLPKVGRTAEKARLELDKIGRTLEAMAEKGKEPTARYLTRTQDRLKLILDKFSKSNAAKDQLGQDAVVKASKLKDTVVSKLNSQIPERVEPAKDYAAAIKRSEVLKTLGNTAKKVATVGPIAALTGYGAAKFFGGQ